MDDASTFDDNTEITLPTPPQSENVGPANTTAGLNSEEGATGVKTRVKRTSSAGGNKKGATKSKVKRQALTDVSNTRDAGSDAEEADDFDELNNASGVDATSAPVMAPKKPAAKKAGAGRPKKQNKDEVPLAVGDTATAPLRDEIPETQEIDSATSKLAKTAAATRKKVPRPAKREMVPETQQEPMDVDDSTIHEISQIDDPALHAKVAKSGRPAAGSRQRQNSIPRRRAGSASDTEKGANDSTLRRKLAEMTRKFEALEVKHQNICDVAVVEAESNFDKLRKKADEKIKAANELIASLRAELATQKAAAAQAEALRSEISNLKSHNETLASEKKSLATSLNDVQNENKTLHAKLAATRSTSNPAQNTSATTKAGGAKTVLVSNAEAAKEAHKRMLKEELYSDLTGLILLDVRRREEENEDLYDCIQTGRNGTLHFHLTVSNATGASKTPGAPSTSYEDAEFQYTPLFDEKRDKDLLEILPDYLTEEICFPRSNAAKFYSRVVDCMTKKVELVEE